ncbi:hypothetical protein N7536_002941 [Penicillium majusculum]|nr:hypothetical protein N7536_002941 [Penicillium majusculum]
MAAFGATSLYHHYSGSAHLGNIATCSHPLVLPTYEDTHPCRRGSFRGYEVATRAEFSHFPAFPRISPIEGVYINSMPSN